MLNLRNVKRVVVLGGGTAGWFGGLTLRKLFSPAVEVVVIESPSVGIVGVGEGGLLNLASALEFHQIDIPTFIRETGAAYKLGFAYEGWRTGTRDDVFYHPFASSRTTAGQTSFKGTFPILTGLKALGADLTLPIAEMSAIKNNASQAEAKEFLAKENASILGSYHFDSYKVAEFLKKVALERGVTLKTAHVVDVSINEHQHVTQIQFEGNETLDVDFLIDASGFARLVVGKKLQAKWRSFKDFLPMNRAIPFHMPHPNKNPHLLTRAIAMNAGWMWQIPLQHRVGAGYVFNDNYLTDEQAIEEIQSFLGFDIDPVRPIAFEAGCYETVWMGNVLAIGLASGFVEPLEATSIGQMLEQLRNLMRVLDETHGIVPSHVIAEFNNANVLYWQGIRDFLRMHYDTPRRDNQFWQDVAKLPFSPEYQSLKDTWSQRSPCVSDIQHYNAIGWHGVFHLHNWIYVGGALGVMPQSVARQEIKFLPEHVKQTIKAFLQPYQAVRAPLASPPIA